MSVFPHQAACSAYQSLGIILILMIKYLKTKKRLLYEGWLLPSKCRKLVNCLAIGSQTILRTKVPLRKTLEPQFASLKTMQPCLGEFSLLL